MTKKQKYSPKNRFNDPQSVEEDIKLADLEVSLVDPDITPVPLNNYLDDEEIIDTLLVDKYANTSADMDEELDNDKIVEDVDLIDEDDGRLQFNIGPVDDDEEVVIEPSTFFDESSSVQDISELHVEPDDLQINTDIGQLKQDTEEPLKTDTDYISENNSSKLGEYLNEKSDEEDEYSNDVNTKQEELSEAEVNANNKALLLIKRALLTDTAFITSIESRVRLANLQKKKPKLEQHVENHNPRKKTLVFVVGGLFFVILIALSIKVYFLSAEISKLQSLTSILEEDVSILHEKKTTLESESNHVSSEAIPQSGQAIIKQEKPIAEEVKQHHEPVNSIQEVSKPLDQVSESKKFTKLQMAPTAPKKLVVDKKLAVKEFKKTPKNQVAKSGWFVNLVTFKVQNEAKKKSVNLIAQGIPVKISTFNAKNTQWYQLSVNGFKNKEAAQSYANKIKKSLDLKTITVQSN